MQTDIIDTNKVKLSPLEAFIKSQERYMRRDINQIVKTCIGDIKRDPKAYTERGTDDPSIDIRLCIDLEPKPSSWIFRVGLSDYDPRHSEYCGGSCIGIDTKGEDLLLELVDQVLEQEASR